MNLLSATVINSLSHDSTFGLASFAHFQAIRDKEQKRTQQNSHKQTALDPIFDSPKFTINNSKQLLNITIYKVIETLTTPFWGQIPWEPLTHQYLNSKIAEPRAKQKK